MKKQKVIIPARDKFSSTLKQIHRLIESEIDTQPLFSVFIYIYIYIYTERKKERDYIYVYIYIKILSGWACFYKGFCAFYCG